MLLIFQNPANNSKVRILGGFCPSPWPLTLLDIFRSKPPHSQTPLTLPRCKPKPLQIPLLWNISNPSNGSKFSIWWGGGKLPLPLAPDPHKPFFGQAFTPMMTLPRHKHQHIQTLLLWNLSNPSNGSNFSIWGGGGSCPSPWPSILLKPSFGKPSHP